MATTSGNWRTPRAKPLVVRVQRYIRKLFRPMAGTVPALSRQSATNIQSASSSPPAAKFVRKPAHGSWYRGEHCNFAPAKAELREEGGIEKFILKGWTPHRPFVTRQTPVTAFGSCFAAHISSHLSKAGYNILTAASDNTKEMNIHNSYVVRFGEGLVNSAVILQQFQWAYEGRKFDENLWYDKNQSFVDYDESVRKQTKSIFEKTELFIITLGLSEVWYNKVTDDVFWRAIPANQFDPAIHGFKMLSVLENKNNICEIYRIIRKYRGVECGILFTLSPIPLVATFRDNSCITSNSVSKASLRVAIDEVMRENQDDKKLFYFPSYEIVKEYFVDPLQDDFRHPKHHVINKIMRVFENKFCVP